MVFYSDFVEMVLFSSFRGIIIAWAWEIRECVCGFQTAKIRVAEKSY